MPASIGADPGAGVSRNWRRHHTRHTANVVRLNASSCLQKTFRFVRAPLPFPLLFGGAPKKKRLRDMKLKVRVLGPLPLFAGPPEAGR